MDTATKTRIDVERVVRKTTEATGGLIGDKIADKITSTSKTKTKGKEDEANKRQETQMPSEKKTANNR